MLYCNGIWYSLLVRLMVDGFLDYVLLCDIYYDFYVEIKGLVGYEVVCGICWYIEDFIDVFVYYLVEEIDDRIDGIGLEGYYWLVVVF